MSLLRSTQLTVSTHMDAESSGAQPVLTAILTERCSPLAPRRSPPTYLSSWREERKVCSKKYRPTAAKHPIPETKKRYDT